MDFLKPTTLKVLEFFFDRPREEFHEREVMRLAKISKGSANKILRELAALAILDRAEKGRMVFYRIRAADPFVRQMKIAGNVWALRPFVEALKSSARKVMLFGSCAEGTNGPESDVDVFILTENKGAVRNSVSAFNRDGARPVAPIIMDEGEFAAMRKQDKPLFERIDRGVVLWEATSA